MSFSIQACNDRGNAVVAWLENEFAGIRTGRATPALLDSVKVESYGSLVPLAHIGSLSVEDARTIKISVWDQSAVKAVERALLEADLGVSAVADSSGVRVFFPELTSERRVQLIKLAKQKLEDARVSIRGIRDEQNKHLEQLKKAGDLSEDEVFSAREQVQKRVDYFNGVLEDRYTQKETEIQS